MKLPRVFTHRPIPRMPHLPGFEPRFDAIPHRTHQLATAVRPLYWWAADLTARGEVLTGLWFDATTLTATVGVRSAGGAVLTRVRRHDDKPHLVDGSAMLLAEGCWRLGALGWTDELDELATALRAAGLMIAPDPVRACLHPIPGLPVQPDRAVRIAYWWAAALTRRGWTILDCGTAVAGGGFIAEVPGTDGAEAALSVYPAGMASDGTEVSALATRLGRLGLQQRQTVQRLIDDAAAAGRER